MVSKSMLIFLTIGILPFCSAINIYLLQTSPEETNDVEPSRRFYAFHPGRTGASKILGVPTSPQHLPEAEPILPGHTLLRPGFSMLKSSVKFPHKDLEDGAGVYGNINNLGITYDGRNERVLYTGFRRSGQRGFQDSENTRVIVVRLPKNQNDDKNIYNAWSQEAEKPNYDWFIEKIYPPFIKNPKYSNAFKQAYNKYHQWNNNLESVDIRNDPSLTLRRTNETKPLGISYDEVEISSEIDVSAENTGKSEAVHSKLEWFWSMKDAYNHIKISHDAPNLNELRPTTPPPPTAWWTFHEYDMHENGMDYNSNNMQ